MVFAVLIKFPSELRFPQIVQIFLPTGTRVAREKACQAKTLLGRKATGNAGLCRPDDFQLFYGEIRRVCAYFTLEMLNMELLFLPAILTICVMLFLQVATIFHFAPSPRRGHGLRMWNMNRFVLRKSDEPLQPPMDEDEGYLEAAA
jgi:hypothetical protein